MKFPNRVLREDEQLESGDLIFWKNKRKPTIVSGWARRGVGEFLKQGIWVDDDGEFRKVKRIERPIILDVDLLISELEKIRKDYWSCES